jgi:hypothetical protein
MAEVRTPPVKAQHIPGKSAFHDRRVAGSFQVSEPHLPHPLSDDDDADQQFWFFCPCRPLARLAPGLGELLMPALLAVWLLAPLGKLAGWVLADWHRVVIVLLLAGYVATWFIAAHHQAAADLILRQQALEAQAKAFIAEADRAQQAETKRQADIGAAVEADFEKQLAARDAADAKTDAQLAKEIADHDKQAMAAGGSCTVGADDGWLQPHAAPRPAARPGGR